MPTSRKPHARRIAAARKRAGLTMYRAAAIAGISPNSWRGYEKDGKEPGLLQAARIATALGVSVDYLAGLAEA